MNDVNRELSLRICSWLRVKYKVEHVGLQSQLEADLPELRGLEENPGIAAAVEAGTRQRIHELELAQEGFEKDLVKLTRRNDFWDQEVEKRLSSLEAGPSKPEVGRSGPPTQQESWEFNRGYNAALRNLADHIKVEERP